MALIDLFVERDKKEKVKEKPQVTESARQTEMVTVTSYPNISTVNMSLVQDFLNKFRKVLADENARNFPGNDYFEFFQMKQAMAAPIPEDIKYQTVFAGWGASGKQSKDTLISTAKSYLGILDRDIADVEAALKSQYDQTVGKNLSLISEKRLQIQNLSNQISNLESEIESLGEGNKNQEVEIVSQREAFAIASKQIREEVLTEIDKITKYIQ